MDDRPPTATLPHLEGTAAATERLLERVGTLTDEDLAASSLLPGWTRGHVLAHLARNADAVTNLVESAATGQERPMYPSQEVRDADIEAGAGRPRQDQLDDLTTSAERFASAARALPADRWEVEVRRTPGAPPFPVRRVGAMRRTEVEVHHADLGVGYTAADWPADLVEHLLARRRRELEADGRTLTLVLTDRDEPLVPAGTGPAGTGPTVTGSPADMVWWLLGRGSGAGLASSTGELPELGRWS